MGLIIVTQPEIEPVTVAEAKAWARIEASSTVHDDLIGSLITSARMKAELHTWRAFITQTLRWSADEWPADGEIKLPRPPLIGEDITVEWVDDDGTWNEVDADDYWIDTDSEPGRLWPVDYWPDSHADAPGAVRVTYDAGYGDTADCVPELIKTAIKKAVATWLEFRQDLVVGGAPELPQTALMDLRPFQILEFR